MAYFLFSFFVGGFLTLIPGFHNLLSLLPRVFYKEELVAWQLFVVWGFVFSLIFFASRDFIAKNGYIAFWKIVVVLAIFVITLAAFILDFPAVQF
ncbi:hypothetical protein A2886_00335 [candidate division WWE3 bacterium RIFCSPHIGHO2_01_FULL_42_13]|uniref:Uncharacterized protein n=1 Tax=candidate division WWE3 bacterium RIFCSPHIGHO2_01_FULL_42_13 TaxID=1802617 RepID=A0A1F4USC3_UNCKA|nr:MAG: hypothetical protein A2886_00335 [candidate division WWE3 bacterium RIFCSPHIGHO2_01_FULL_42_13]